MLNKTVKVIFIILGFLFLPALSGLAVIQEQHSENLGMIIALLLVANQIWIIGGIFLLTTKPTE